MDKRFEKKVNDYREELSAYLRSNNTTLVEYAKALGEEYISPILYPENIDELNLAKKSFEVYKTINDSKINVYFDYETNYMYAIYQCVIEELKSTRNYKTIENALYVILSDSKLRGKLRIDMQAFIDSDSANIDILEMMTGDCKSHDEAYARMDRVARIISTLFDRATNKVLSEKPEMYDNLLPNENIEGMRSYISSNQDVYNYIISEKLNINPYVKKLK